MDDDDYGDHAHLAALTDIVEQPRARPTTSAQPSNRPRSPRKVVQPTPQALPTRHTASSLLVSTRQKGNPLLTHITSLPWEYTDTNADYVLGATTCALFLSLKYHRLHPEYIYTRMKKLGKDYDLRVMLALVDIDAHEEPLRELAKTALINNYTLILAWSAREAARYLEAYKTLERAAPTAIKGQQATGYAENMVDFVTVPRGVNKADAVGVVSAFGSVRAAINAHPEELAAVQGWGEVKVKRWSGAVREPFRLAKADKTEGRGAAFTSLGAVSRQEVLQRQDTASRAQAANDAEELLAQAPMAWEPEQEDEDAILSNIHERTDPITGASLPEEDTTAPAADKTRYDELDLDEGIASALAKYRNG